MHGGAMPDKRDVEHTTGRHRLCSILNQGGYHEPKVWSVARYLRQFIQRAKLNSDAAVLQRGTVKSNHRAEKRGEIDRSELPAWTLGRRSCIGNNHSTTFDGVFEIGDARGAHYPAGAF